MMAYAATILVFTLATAAPSAEAVAEEDSHQQDGFSLLQTSKFQLGKAARPSLFDAGRGLVGQLLNEKPVLRSMAAAPLDPVAQVSGCRTLSMIIPAKRDALATPAVVEPIMAAIRGHVAERGVVTACVAALKAFMSSRTTVSLFSNETHTAEVLAAVLRYYADDWQMQTDVLPMPASLSDCSARKPYVQAGCVDLTWDALERFGDRAQVQGSAWQAFMQYALCPTSSDAIAEYKGNNEGVRRLVQSLRDAVARHTKLWGIASLQHHILSVGDVVLQGATDFNGRFDAYDHAGYGEAALSSMEDEQSHPETIDRACFALHLLTEHDVTHAKLLAAGALETIVSAMKRFRDKATGPFADFFPVLPSCDGALRNLARESRATQDALLELGAIDVYASMRQDLLPSNPKMLELPRLLRARQAQLRQNGGA